MQELQGFNPTAVVHSRHLHIHQTPKPLSSKSTNSHTYMSNFLFTATPNTFHLRQFYNDPLPDKALPSHVSPSSILVPKQIFFGKYSHVSTFLPLWSKSSVVHSSLFLLFPNMSSIPVHYFSSLTCQILHYLPDCTLPTKYSFSEKRLWIPRQLSFSLGDSPNSTPPPHY